MQWLRWTALLGTVAVAACGGKSSEEAPPSTGGGMMGMHMAGDARWNALTDSVKRDLAELPNLQGKAFAERMKTHAGRAKRLMAMHEQMMKGMQ